MLAQERVHLAGHVGGEARDAPVLHLDPFGMRAGGADQPVLDAGAENQRLLAAHHIGGAGSRLAEQAGNDVALAAVLQIHRHEGLGDFRRAGRAGGIGRLDPALAASHHADQQHRRIGLGLQPMSALAQEHVAMLALLQGRNTFVRRDLVEDGFVLEQITAEAGRSPIGDDEAQGE